MDPSLHMLLQYAVTQNTPLKIRSSSIPPSGKILQAQDVNQDLLVELDGATLNEGPHPNDSHYILAQCDEISPSTDHLPQAPAGGPLKITSLEHKNQVIYHDDHWDAKELPHILRTPSPTGSESRSQKARLRRESVCRVVPGTSQEESIEGIFLPNAGAEEEHTARWLNKVTEALMALDPTRGPLTRSRLATRRCWSSEASRKPMKDSMMILKPDLILREKGIGAPRPDFSWDGVVSFLELTSSTFQDSESVGVGCVRNAIMRKAYALFASQPGRRFLFALSIAKQEFRVHMFDRAGVVHSRGYDIHRSPRILLRMLSLLAFGRPEQIGYDITLTYSTPVPRLLSNSQPDFGVITVRSHTYTIIRKIFYGFLICGRATSCWHVKRNNQNYVIKDAWTHESRESREEDILNKIKDVEGVPRLVDAWTVEIKGLQDRTSTRRSALLPSNNEVRVHRRLVMQPVAIPLTDFTSIRELVSVLIDVLDVHQKLVIDFHILHRDISLNNIMIYVISTLAKNRRVGAGGTSSANDDHVELQVPVDENAVAEEETHEQKLARWEGERLQMIQAGELRRGILVDFDYATTMQPGSKPVGVGARTGTIPFMSANILLHYRKPDTVHTASDDIESLIYVLTWICVLYAGPKTLRQDKHAMDTMLKSWVSVCSANDAVALGIHKKGIHSEPGPVTEDFTVFFKPLRPIVEKLLRALGKTWSTVDAMHNYKIVRDILIEGFGTVEGVPDWSPVKDAYGYGLLGKGTGSGPVVANKRKLFVHATDGCDAAESSRPSVRRRRH